MASLVLVVKSADPGLTDLAQDDTAGHEALLAISNHFAALSSGNEKGTVYAHTSDDSPVAASGTFTLATAVATDAVTVGGVTFTFTATPSEETDVESDGADDTADAAALAAAINAHSALSEVVTATSAAEVVTVTAKQAGVVGNFITISSADATITASGTALEGGTGGAATAAKTWAFGE